MVLLKKIFGKKESLLIITSKIETFVFDYPAELYGKHIRQPSFSDPPKPLRFIKPSVKCPIDFIFVSKSESLGVLFLDREIDIYITLPVYEQILMKYNLLRDLSLTYDHDEIISSVNSDGITTSNNYEVVDFKEANIELFKKNVRFIQFNEYIEFNTCKVIPKSSGIFIGWCSFMVYFQNGKSLHYISDISYKNKFAIPSEPQDSDYKVINSQYVDKKNKIQSEEVERFNRLLTNNNDKTIIIPLDLPTLFIDIIFHLFYVLNQRNKIPIYVISSHVNKYVTLLNLQTDWCNEKYSNSKEPFNLQKYERCFILDSFPRSIEGPCIIICDKLKYKSSVFSYIKNLLPISISDETISFKKIFHIESKSNLREIHDKEGGVEVKLSRNEECYYIPSSSEFSFVAINDCDEHDNTSYIDGYIKNTDADTKNKIGMNLLSFKTQFFNQIFRRERFFYINNSWVFPRLKLKITKSGMRYKACKIR